MALVRCEPCMTKASRAGHIKRTYVVHVQPVGYPNTAVFCGSPSCESPGLIWLEGEEQRAYNAGRRLFSLQTNTTKVRAQ